MENEPVSLDDLLLFLSAKGSGSWPQFRGAVEELHVDRVPSTLDDGDTGGRTNSDLPVYHEVRFVLQRLGHVEFLGENKEYAWRVVPPSVAMLPGEDGCGLLCGARSTAVLATLAKFAEVEAQPAEGMPERVLLRNRRGQDLATAARAHGFNVQQSAPRAILCAIPGARDLASWPLSEMPQTPGWTIHRFSPSQLRWIPAVADEANRASNGLFRFVMKHQRFYYMRSRGLCYGLPVQVAKYAVMRRRTGILQYERNTLSVPVICRPPLLIERALVLCSGLLPRVVAGRVEYIQVPRDVARLTAELLGQNI
jgi:hypothetical protein